MCRVPQEKIDCLNTVLDNKTYFYLEKGKLDAATEPLASNLGVQSIETDFNGKENSVTIQNKVVSDLTDPALNLPDFKTIRYRIIGGISVATASSHDSSGTVLRRCISSISIEFS